MNLIMAEPMLCAIVEFIWISILNKLRTFNIGGILNTKGKTKT